MVLPGLTSACRRPPPAYAPTSLRLPAAPEAQHSALRAGVIVRRKPMTQHILRCALSVMLMALSVPAAAQQPQHIPRIGYLSTRPAEMEQRLLPVFLHGLQDLGYTEGKNIVVERRYAAVGQHERIRDLVAEMVRLKVDVIVVIGPDITAAAKEATTTIPIIFISPDPVGLGLVASLARPGG